MTRIEIDLPDATATAAREEGLLTPHALDRLLIDAIERRRAANALLSIADRLTAAAMNPVSMQEIDAEVKRARRERSDVASSR